MLSPTHEIKDRLIQVLREKNITPKELSEKTGIPKSSISQYMSGYAKPKQDRIYLISKALDINPTWLLGYDVDINIVKQNEGIGVKIPILGTVIAGIPVTAVEDIIGYEEINEKMARCGDYFALEIKGDSMEPKMSKGDIVIVKQQNTVENGQIAIVLVNGDEATVKKVRFRDNGIELIAFNSYVYEPHFYSAKEIDDLPVKIIGRVVELRAKF